MKAPMGMDTLTCSRIWSAGLDEAVAFARGKQAFAGILGGLPGRERPEMKAVKRAIGA